MPTIVSFYQRFPNEAPPLNLSAFDRTGYTYAENSAAMSVAMKRNSAR